MSARIYSFPARVRTAPVNPRAIMTEQSISEALASARLSVLRAERLAETLEAIEDLLAREISKAGAML